MPASPKKQAQEPDEFLDASHRLWVWASENRAKAVAAVGAVVAVLLVAILAKGLLERRREQRAAEVAAAIEQASASPDAASAAALGALADRIGTGPGGAVARYFAAGALAGAGEDERAAEAYERAARDAGGSDLAPLARLGAAYLALSRGEDAAAAAAFEALLATGDAVLPRALLRLELAALREREGRFDDARELLEEVSAAHPEGPLGTRARERLAALPAAGTAS